jgi:uncharacterized protein (DUF1697 family)
VTAYAVLLRGVNVGGHGKIPMAELREVVAGLGCSDVATYVQSGNVVGRSDDRPAELAGKVSQAIRDRWGLDVGTVVRTHEQLQQVVRDNPFGEPDHGSRLHVAFLLGEPARDALEAFDQSGFAPDRFALADREIYLSLPDGIGRSKLAAALTERRAGTTMTVRNWNTVRKLLEMTAS